jgi:hypothetical protein
MYMNNDLAIGHIIILSKFVGQVGDYDQTCHQLTPCLKRSDMR